jgi:hypothetical protein
MFCVCKDFHKKLLTPSSTELCIPEHVQHYCLFISIALNPDKRMLYLTFKHGVLWNLIKDHDVHT